MGNPIMTITSIIGRKRVNSDEDVRPTKLAKVEDDVAEEVLIDDEVNRPRAVLEGDLKKPAESEQDIQTGEESAAQSDDELKKLCTQTGGGAEEVAILRKKLKKHSKNLDEEYQDCIIHCMPVEEIISLALELGQEKGSDEEEETASERLPCFGETRRLVKCMLRSPEKVKKSDFCSLYKKMHYKDFALVALLTLDSNQQRCLYYWLKEQEPTINESFDEEAMFKLLRPLSREQRAITIPALCRALPPNVFDHVFHDMTKLHLFGSAQEQSGEDCPAAVPDISNKRAEASDVENFEASDVEYIEISEDEDTEEAEEHRRKAAQECQMCLGKGTHMGPMGHYCSYRDFVPKGATVGPDYIVGCRRCGLRNENPVDDCWSCDSEGGEALPRIKSPIFVSLPIKWNED